MARFFTRRGGRGPRPVPLPRLGLYHLTPPDTLTPLNATALQLLHEGLPIAAVDPLRCPAYAEDGTPATTDGLPLWQALAGRTLVESALRLEGEGLSGRLLLTTAAPLLGADGALTGVALAAVLRPPEPDWEELAGLAHDLRSPLQAIKLLVPVLEAMPLPEAARDIVGRLGKSAARVGELGQEMLEWCKAPTVGAPLASHAWVDLGPVLRAAVAEQQPAARARDVRLVWDAPAADGVAMFTDAGRLSRLLANLLSNGVRYTAARGEVRLSAEWRGGGGGDTLLTLTIADSGVGLTEEESESVFQPFQRGRAGQTVSGSSGVGLAVVDRLVNELGLSLEVTSESGAGSRFVLVVPAGHLRVG